MSLEAWAAVVRDGTDCTPRQARETVERILDTVREALRTEGAIRLHGFGTFARRDMPQRQGTNPATGEALTIPPRSRVAFLASARLKADVQPERPAKRQRTTPAKTAANGRRSAA